MDKKILKENMIRVLENHRGRSRAIRRNELFEKILPNGGKFTQHTADRTLRELKRELIAEHIPVLFCTQNPGGYYLAANHQELREGIEERLKYLHSEATVIRDLKKAKSFLKPEQGRLI